MNEDFIKQQQAIASERLSKLIEAESDKNRKVSIVFQYLSSLLDLDDFTDAQKEDLRKLALELGYKEDIDFETWFAGLPE